MTEIVRKRPRGCSTVTSKHQLTIPAETFKAAGLTTGDSMRGTALGPGRVLFERVSDAIADTAGVFDGLYPPDALDRLRDEWE